MTAHIVEKMSGVRRSWKKIRRARCLMSRGLTRQRIFERAKSRSDELFSETEKIIPPYMREADEGQWLVHRLGGLEEISKNARNAQSIIPEVIEALEADVSAIEFEKLARRDRKHRILEKISRVLYYASFAAVGIGAFVSLAMPKILGTPQDDRLYNTGLYIAVGGISSAFLTSAVREVIEYVRPGIRKIKEAIRTMREGLKELGQSLQELLDAASVSPR